MRAAPIQAGFDLFETDPTTTFHFSVTPLPAGFFGPGSDPFTADVRFGGEPLNTFHGIKTGDADTVVQRMASDDPTVTPGMPIPTQLMALNLRSISPLVVKVGTKQELWDAVVTLSKSRPSIGSMVPTESGRGGTFNSTLHVFPLFTFIRLSDHAKRTLDTGGLPLPKAYLDALTLIAANTPFRLGGCTPPALSIKGLNDGFCPSETPDDKKQLTYEESSAAAHGIRPVQPRLEHFKCYVVRGKFTPRVVALSDQFGGEHVTVLRPQQLCAPVRKNVEARVDNEAAHLKCYAIRDVTGSPAFVPRSVPVRNQFGMAQLSVLRPVTLCEPAQKQPASKRGTPKPLTPDRMIDNFKCYAVRSLTRFKGPIVHLKDQFGGQITRVLQPRELCAPAQKDSESVMHPVRHLVCYQISGPPVRRVVAVFDQFGREILPVGSPTRLCVPSTKGVPNGPPPFIPPNIPPTTPPTTPTLTRITVTPPTATVIAGHTQHFDATGTYSDGSTQLLTTTVTWSSSNTSVATVSNTPGAQGNATGQRGGSATITATTGGVQGTAMLNVTPVNCTAQLFDAGGGLTGLRFQCDQDITAFQVVLGEYQVMTSVGPSHDCQVKTTNNTKDTLYCPDAVAKNTLTQQAFQASQPPTSGHPTNSFFDVFIDVNVLMFPASPVP